MQPHSPIAAGVNPMSRDQVSRAGGLPSGRRTPFAVVAAIVVIVVLVYGAVVWAAVRPYGGNVSALIDIGQHAGEGRGGIRGHHVVVFLHTEGYDGQEYYYVADDPLLLQPHPAYRDAFRYSRIGYPLLVAVVSLGQRDLRPIAMLLVNLGAVVALALLCLAILQTIAPRASPWWALPCAITPSLLLGVQLDLSEPLAFALAFGGLLALIKDRVGWATVMLAAALLTREVTILFVIAGLVALAQRRRWRDALLLCACVLPYGLWQLVLRWRLGHTGASGTGGNVGPPFEGIAAVARAALAPPHRAALIHQGPTLVIIALVLLAIVVGVQLWRVSPSPIAAALVLHGGAALFAGGAIWLAYASAARVFGAIYPLVILAHVRRPTRLTALLALLVIALTLLAFARPSGLGGARPYILTP